MLNRIPEFEIATRDEGLSWHRIELSGAFADWMDTYDPIERKDTLADPDIVESYADPGFIEFLSGRLGREMESVPPADAVHTVFAVSGSESGVTSSALSFARGASVGIIHQ